ncbi:MAG: serine hydrolase [Oscillospiraceae bacterium]|nr:serine hydrolase [Oscillospiraceae bacterium]
MSNFKDLDALLQKYVDDGLPGCGMVIAKKGEILYEKYFGYADVENKVPLEQKHLFRQASLTKVAMYTTAMMLYEQGKFLMTDPIYEYFPEWKNTMKRVTLPNGKVEIVPVEHPITVKNIMNMTCGLPYHMIMGNIPLRNPVSESMGHYMEPLFKKGHFTLREQIAAMSQVPIAFEPGERWLYGFASELTAGLIEAVGGKPAEKVIKEMLFEPLQMNTTANYLEGDMGERLVKNYVLAPGKKLGDEGALVIRDDSMMVGPLGTVNGFSRVVTNPSDYTHLIQMLANGGKWNGEQIMGRKTIDLMRTNTISQELIDQDLANNYLCGYGYGYGVRCLMDKHVGHSNGSLGQFGWTGGSGTWGEADPSEGTSIVYMHNLQPNLEEYHHLRMRAVAYGCL